MFYRPDTEPHGLAFNPFKSCVVPRPIGWIVTLKPGGAANVAPFSQFNIVGFDPGYVMFSANAHPPDFKAKHSTEYAEMNGEFVYNMATADLRQSVVDSSYLMDRDSDDIATLGLTAAAGVAVKTPRIAQSPVAFECRYHTTLVLPGNSPDTTHRMVIGRVVGIYIDDKALAEDGRLDVLRVKPLARLGYTDYSSIDSLFTVTPQGAGAAGIQRKMAGGA
ncbi:MAG: flavin reductase family protein [Ramlibacter sp.]|nr:flavin reductase family protein [Ramlibacter sp.]